MDKDQKKYGRDRVERRESGVSTGCAHFFHGFTEDEVIAQVNWAIKTLERKLTPRLLTQADDELKSYYGWVRHRRAQALTNSS